MSSDSNFSPAACWIRWVLLIAGLTLSLHTPVARAWNGFDLGDFGFEQEKQFHIRMQDGTRLAGHLIVPARPDPADKLPAVILVDDWARTPGELILQSAQFAAEGFVVVRYQARGFGHSSGSLDLAGPLDVADFSAVVDWVLEHAPVDGQRIGVVGVSVGGAIALIAAAEDSRLRAVAALSGWADLEKSIFRNGAGNPEWISALSDSAVPRRISVSVAERVRDLQSGIVTPEAMNWAAQRSPELRLEALNRRGVPVFLASGYHDELVDLNGQLEFFERLQTPKRLVFSQSEHAALEAHELLTGQTYLWADTLEWMRTWLRDDQMPRASQPIVSMELGEVSVRDEFTQWPSPLVDEAAFYLTPRESSGHGTIAKAPWGGKMAVSNTLNSGADSAATVSVDQVVEAGESDLPSAVWLPNLDHQHSIVFESRELARPLPLRGAPQVELWLSSSAPKARLVVYLYEANTLGLGRLISHGGGAVNVIPNQPFPLRVDLRPIAHDLQPGNQVVLVIDTEDPRYAFPGNSENFALRVLFSEQHRPMLRVPYNQTLVSQPVRVADGTDQSPAQPR